MSQPSSPLKSFTCPTCGAPLEIDPNQPIIRCDYCNASIDNPEYQHPQVDPETPLFTVVDWPLVRPRQPSRSRLPWAFAIIGVILVVTVGAVVLVNSIISGSPPSLNLFPLQIRTPVLLLPAQAQVASPELVAVTYASGGSYSLARLDIANHKVVWTSLKQEDYLSVDALTAGDSLIYLVIKDRLIAVQAGNGQQVWEATLPDSLLGSCNSCLQVVNGQVVVLTNGDTLAAYNSLTGHQTWEKTFNSAGDALYPYGSGVGLVYSLERGSALGIFAAASGDEIARIAPTCVPTDGFGDEMDNYSEVLFDPSDPSSKVYVLFGFFNACVQRWDLSTMSMDWQYLAEDKDLNRPSDAPALLAGGRLYFLLDDQLLAIDSTSGSSLLSFGSEPDYDRIPLLVIDQKLIVRATRTKGTSRSELWGYELSGGQPLWKRPLVGSSPIDPPQEMVGLLDKDESGWTLQSTSAGLWLVTFQAAPHQVELARVAPTSGELSGPIDLPLGIDSSMDFYDIPTHLAGQDDLAWFTLEGRLFAIDPSTGTFAYRWP